MHVRHWQVPAALAALVAAVALSLVAGCAPGAREQKAKLTEHQRDSVLATEPIPGASTVGRALDESAKASESAAQMDSLSR